MHPGCGVQLAYKIIKDSGILNRKAEAKPAKTKHPKHQPQFFISPAVAAHLVESAGLVQLTDPTAAPQDSIVISDDLTAREHMHSLSQAKDLIYICINSSGKQYLAKRLGIDAWSATCSVAFYDDLIGKLQKATKLQGLRFIELLTPCPKLWHSEPSNTIELARQAVEIGLWPLFELDRGKFTLTHKPAKISPTDAFVSLQKLIKPDHAALEKSWRLMTLGKPFESEI